MLAYAEKRKPSMPPEAALLSRNVDVLVVHDEDLLRQFLNAHLWRAGYHVRMARSAVEAGALVFESTPGVMVLDIDMQGMNCFEFLAGIRAERAIPYFPVVYLTADMNAASCAHEFGAACVRKPIQPGKLLATIALSALIQRPPSRTAWHLRSIPN